MKIAQGKFIVKLISLSEDTDNLPWKNLVAQKSGDGHTENDFCSFEKCFFYTGIIFCAVIIADDRLRALRDAKNNRVKSNIYFRDNTDAGERNISSIL